MVRRSIALAGFCVLFAAVLVISLFVTSLAGADIPWLFAAFFILSLLCLIASLVEFIRDVNRSLEPVALEVGEEWEKKRCETDAAPNATLRLLGRRTGRSGWRVGPPAPAWASAPGIRRSRRAWPGPGAPSWGRSRRRTWR